jgi:DNA-directed RNA polymerase specialized sigma24 family protein
MRSSCFRRPITKCEDLTIWEIAGRLGVTREGAKSRLRRARALVREYLLGTKDSGREST